MKRDSITYRDEIIARCNCPRHAQDYRWYIEAWEHGMRRFEDQCSHYYTIAAAKGAINDAR